MDTTRWQRMQALFHEASDRPTAEQAEFLQAACGGDEALAAEVTAMLEADARGGSLLDRNVAHVADRMLAGASPVAAKEFGPYTIKELLGEGGMGVVYLAERKDLGNLVAIKILRDAWLSPARRERFASEQRMLAGLNHASIARLYDADTLADGTPWFVMEYVEGLPLTDYCQKYNCSVERRLQLFRQVCEAVQYAHAHAVIHRDLKPSNIFVKPDGSVRLLDFGIAKQMENLDSPVESTQTLMRLMTPAYAAPEQIRGGSVGVHTDVYSLGVILYQLLSERLPFDLSNLSPAEAASVIAEHQPGKPSAANPAQRAVAGKTAWADLDVLCLTAMHKDPERRYRSVEALVRDVDHYLRGEPLEARPDRMSYRAGKFVKRNRSAVVSLALVFAMVTALVIFFTIRLAKARDAALAEAARTQRIQRFMTNLFEGGDEAVGPADDLRVITLVDRGVEEAGALEGEPAVQAELYQTLGGIYENLGKLEQAEKLIRSSLEQRKSLFGGDSPQVAESLVEFGLLRDRQAKYEEAEGLARQGLDMSRRHLAANHPAVARATSALGKVLEDRGQYEQGIKVLEEAVRLQSVTDSQSADLAASLTELANCHFYAGHYAISDSLNQRVLAMDRKLYGDRHPHIADDLINLGAIQVEWGHYAEAEKYYRQGLSVMQSFYGKDHPETASAFTLVGQALVSEGKLEEADSVLRQALEIEERVFGKEHQRVALTLNELGRVAQSRGKLSEAEADFRRQVEIYQTVYNGKHYVIGVALSNLAGVYAVEKKYEQAERLFQAALRMYADTLSADHQLVGIARIRLGGVFARAQRFVEAEAESRAGYEVLMKQTNAPTKWLQSARSDLVKEYEALHQPEQAAKYRAEIEERGVALSRK